MRSSRPRTAPRRGSRSSSNSSPSRGHAPNSQLSCAGAARLETSPRSESREYRERAASTYPTAGARATTSCSPTAPTTTWSAPALRRGPRGPPPAPTRSTPPSACTVACTAEQRPRALPWRQPPGSGGEALDGPRPPLGRFDLTVLRRRRRDKPCEQVRRRKRDLVDGAIEGL